MTRTCTIEQLQTDPMMVFREVNFSKEPVFVDQHGSSSVVLVDADTYLTAMQALREFRRIFEQCPVGKPQQAAAL